LSVDSKKSKCIYYNHIYTQDHCLKYTAALEERQRFVLTIWPEHCIQYSEGQKVYPILATALEQWSKHNHKEVLYIEKGLHPLTEMYSALQAEVPIDGDESTALNQALLSQLQQSKRLLICGQARSHCVNYTVRDLVEHWPNERYSEIMVLSDGKNEYFMYYIILRIFIRENTLLLYTGCSSVTGCEADGDRFLEDMRRIGVQVCNCNEAFQI
jgi:nicotinamidase-related amidase